MPRAAQTRLPLATEASAAALLLITTTAGLALDDQPARIFGALANAPTAFAGIAAITAFLTHAALRQTLATVEIVLLITGRARDAATGPWADVALGNDANGLRLISERSADERRRQDQYEGTNEHEQLPSESGPDVTRLSRKSSSHRL